MSFTEAPSVLSVQQSAHTGLHALVCVFVCVCVCMFSKLCSSVQAGARRCVLPRLCAPHARALAAHNYGSFRLMLPMFDYSDQGPSYGD